MTTPGAGDRWLAGDLPDGVRFPPQARVRVLAGPHAGAAGEIVLLIGLRPEPRYLVRLGAARGEVRLMQSVLEGLA